MEKVVDVFAIKMDELDIDEEAKDILIAAGFNTVGDIIANHKNDIYALFANRKNYEYKYLLYFRKLTRILHCQFNVGFYEEFKDLGIDDRLLFIRLETMNLSESIVKILNHRLGIYILGDLLNTNYEEIAKARNMGNVKIRELLNCVHKLGLILKNEPIDINKIREGVKSKGQVLLEDIFDNSKLYMLLYRNNIYTLDDLQNYGFKVFTIKRLGKALQEELRKKLAELNIDLSLVTDINDFQVDDDTVNEEVILRQRQENDLIKARLLKKKELLDKYKILIEEKNKLLAEEKRLDDLINSILINLNDEESTRRK